MTTIMWLGLFTGMRAEDRPRVAFTVVRNGEEPSDYRTVAEESPCAGYLRYLYMQFKNIVDITEDKLTFLWLFFTSDETRSQHRVSRGLPEIVGVTASI